MYILLIITNGEKRKKFGNESKSELVSLIPAWRSSLSVTFSAVHWSATVGFEGNFTFLSTFSANCLGHFFSFIRQLTQLLHGCCAQITSYTLPPPFTSPLIKRVRLFSLFSYSNISQDLVFLLPKTCAFYRRNSERLYFFRCAYAVFGKSCAARFPFPLSLRLTHILSCVCRKGFFSSAVL